MRSLLLAAVVLSMAAPAPAPTKPAPGAGACPFKDKEKVAVDGVARSVQSGAEEPGESINTYFYLDTSGPPCGRLRISVFAAGIIPCLEGDRVTVSGLYYVPSEAPFDYPMIDLATVTCKASR